MSQNTKLPFHLEAEQSILGIIFLDNSKLKTVVEVLNTEDFFNLEHQYIYEAMKNLDQSNKSIDYFSVNAVLEQKKHKIENGKKYLIELSENIPSIYHLDTYIEFVRDAALRREVIMTISSIYNEGVSNHDIDFQNYLNNAEEKLFAIAKKKQTSNLIEINQLLTGLEKKIFYNQKEKKVIGLSTDFSSLDDVTLGFKPEELIILAARPSMGKSTFMSNLAVNISRRNNKAFVVLFSLEMSNEQLCTRMISAESGIPHKQIQLGRLNNEELKLLEFSSVELKNLNILFNDSASANILDIRSQCRKMKNQNKLDIVIIDYLQLIGKSNRHNSRNFYNRQEEIADISKSLKQMARELKIPVLALSQLSREVEKREDKRPILSDLRDSGSIEQDADIVMFLYRPDYYDKEKKHDITNKIVTSELIISKNRQGAVGIRKFNLDLSCLKFTEVNLF
ncbi:replicative DNA helicase [Candidatus Phytoplasma luffae]|uniref:Replicative DNA helicase n=1 Tax=Loofah witches'-broom phytoplasma TaxID=35773 RepID=A0A975FL74_LOWBP|nr:replicative DNA helicase [Candidatus Phytoplasma luffae]QTX02885.1 replicative DNA helicase [Candidatus Phytoplasma luffae]QTX03016.1 replicative DNA helicase [Candidatus Phytoplasma luffae]